MDSGLGGQIHGISLDSFLQMVQMEKSSCTLTVKAGEKAGLLFVNKGELVSAETGSLRDYDAAIEIISWENSLISIENSCDRTQNDINQPLMTVLMEGLKKKDEARARQEEIGDLNLELVNPNLGMPEAPEAPPPGLEKDAIPVNQVDPDIPQPPPLPGMDAPGEPAAPAQPGVEAIPIKPDTGGLTPPMGATPAKKGGAGLPKIAIIGGGVLAVVVIAAAAFLFLGGPDPVEEYEVLLDRIAAIEDPQMKVQLLQEFIDTHQIGDTVELARNEIAQVQADAEKQVYDVAMARLKALPLDTNYPAAAADILDGYLQKYPQGAFADQIRKQMAAIPAQLEEAEYQRILALKGKPTARVEAMRGYLAVYPQGRYVAEVRQALWQQAEPYYRDIQRAASICDEQRNWDNCIQMTTQFLEDFGDHRLAAEAEQLKLSLEDRRDLKRLRTEVSRKMDDYSEDRKRYLAFLKKHPDSAYKSEIDAALQRIDIELAKLAEYETLMEYATNSHNDIRERVKRLKAYLKQEPDRRYARKAEEVLDDLQPQYKSVMKQMADAQAQKDAAARQERERQRQKQERQRKSWETEKLQAQLKQLGKRYSVKKNGVFTDKQTGLTWVMLDSYLDQRKCMTYAAARDYVGKLTTGGYSDWRIPSPSELAGLYKRKPFFPGSGAAWYWTSETYVKGYHQFAYIVTPIPEMEYQKKSANLKKCGAVRAVRR
jgi:hypothetical protein